MSYVTTYIFFLYLAAATSGCASEGSMAGSSGKKPTPAPVSAENGARENMGEGEDGESPGEDDMLETSTSKPFINSDEITQTDDKQIIFGRDKLFHIGDGQASESSCVDRVTSFGTSGIRYRFEFDVRESQTEVQISINDICGVDFPDTNRLELKSAGKVHYSAVLKPGAPGFTLPMHTLAAGSYTLEVVSNDGTQSFEFSPDERDDYLIGNVKLEANKAIRALSVNAD